MHSESAWTFVRLGLETPFVVFHLSVLLSVSRQICRGHPTFRSAFFYIYLIQSGFDVWNYYMTVLIYRLPRIGAIPKVVLDYPLGTLLNLVANYCLYYQFIAHSAIALNRYALIALRSGFWTTVRGRCRRWPWPHVVDNRFVLPKLIPKPDGDPIFQVWKGGKLKVVILIMFLLPLPGTIPRLWCVTEAVETTTPGIYTVVCNASWVYGVGNVASVIYSTVTSAISLALELGTLLAYRKLSDQRRRRYREDYRLLRECL
ncbi:hypothetical protein AAVH_43564 [Aphelenchoides avenae]|nr:hypothetical protein AAVH_43564 [Aphelenchus avenae]